MPKVPKLSGGNLRWSADGKSIYFNTTLAGTEQLFEVPLKGGKIRQITSGPQNYNGFELVGKDHRRGQPHHPEQPSPTWCGLT